MGKKRYYPVSTMEFQGWINASEFKSLDQMRESLSYSDERFLRYVIYPMFYYLRDEEHYNSEFCFPLISKTYSTRKRPIFVIDNDYFTIVFLQHVDLYGEGDSWQVSFHVKDSEWCKQRILDFKKWYVNHYGSELYCEMSEMPKRFIFPKLDLLSRTTEDFCIEFWNFGKEFMLFKFFDTIRIF